jgi:two-component system nitrate/nitrite response regulator NarP
VILLTAELEDAALLGAIKARVDGIVFKHGVESHLLDAVNAIRSGQRFVDPALIDRAFALANEPPRRSPIDNLSVRERQIVEAVARGKRNRDIAESTGMSEGSIKIYLHRIYEKLGIENRTELAIMVLEQDRK